MFSSKDSLIQIETVDVTVNVPSKYVDFIKKIAEDLFNEEGFETWRNQTHPTAGRILYAARLKNNLTQKDFCKKAKIAVTYLSKMENDKQEITPEYAERFAHILHISKDLLLK